MADLTDCYRRYYQYPNIDNASQLWDAILNYEWSTWTEDQTIISEIHSQHLRKCDLDQILYSNGSTRGHFRTYHFGPCWPFWHQNIEKKLRHTEGKHVVKIYSPTLGRLINKGLVISNSEPDFTHLLGDVSWPRTMDLAISKIYELLSNADRICLLANPNVWLFLTTHPHTCDWLNAISDKVDFVSTDWESFFPQNRLRKLIIDQMIDWSSGNNFWTCSRGRRHLLPIFSPEGRNLLNLSDEAAQQDDLWVVGDFYRCPCGLMSPTLKFIPHINCCIKKDGEPIFNPSLADHLKGRYTNLQFHQSIDIINCLYSGNISEDADEIVNYWGKYGFHTKMHPNKCLQINRKRFSFWSNPVDQTYELKPIIGRML